VITIMIPEPMCWLIGIWLVLNCKLLVQRMMIDREIRANVAVAVRKAIEQRQERGEL